jgi:hypothetical protein
MNTKEKIAIMQASDSGKEIEFRWKHTETWEYCPIPGWDWSTFDFRIKPDNKVETKIAYHKNGNPKSLKTYNKKGNEDGVKIEFGENGKIKFIGYYDDGIFSGVNIGFYDDGNIEVSCNYVNNRLEGNYIDYYQDGTVSRIRNFRNGEIVTI